MASEYTASYSEAHRDQPKAIRACARPLSPHAMACSGWPRAPHCAPARASPRPRERAIRASWAPTPTGRGGWREIIRMTRGRTRGRRGRDPLSPAV